jgi:capsular exopolysaccharide synthesis family protein
MSARQGRRGPDVQAAGTRFLVAHVFWILAVTIATVGAAAALVLSQKPLYKSQAVVAVEPPAAAASSGNPPNMATEENIVTSGAVLASAARLLHVPMATLASGVSVHVPSTTTLLQIAYTDSVPRVAQERAQAIAQAYISYRSPQSAASNGKSPAKPAPLSTTPSAVLVTPAPLPASSTGPDYKIDLGAALIVGLALGIGTAGLRDHIDDRLRGLFDLEAQAAAPVLGLIPAFRPGWRDPGGRLVMAAKSDSLVAEAYRGLRSRLAQAAPPNAKTVLVTSPGWEDKSTVAANLAAAFAQADRDVVLVGADLRWGRAHELFSGESGPGLSGLLEGRTSLEGAFQATGIPGLRLLPPGMTPADPAALLERPAWRLALGHIRMHTDVVIIEAPPLLASADACRLAELTDMILIVADARRTTRAQLRVAMREVERERDKLAGCVLDNVGRRRRLRPPQQGPAADSRGEADGSRVASSGAALAEGQGSSDPAGADSGLGGFSADQERRDSGRDSGADRDINGADRGINANWDPATDQSITPANGSHNTMQRNTPPSDEEPTEVIHLAEQTQVIRSASFPPSLLPDGKFTSRSADGELIPPDPADSQPASRLADSQPVPPGPAECEGAGSAATARPSTSAESAEPAEAELTQPAGPQPSDSRRDRLYPVRTLVIMILAALIGSALVMILRSGVSI